MNDIGLRNNIGIICLICIFQLITVSCSPQQDTANNTASQTSGSVYSETSESTTILQTTSKETTQTVETIEEETKISINRLYEFLSDEENGNATGNVAVKLHYGEWHNACVYVAAEAMRRTGEDIPVETAGTTVFISVLKKLGYERFDDLELLLPGDICFTTDEYGNINDDPTHVYIFLAWESEGIAYIYDNQVYDYGTLYHTRDIGFSYFQGDKNKPKEATAFFLRKQESEG